MSNESDAAPAGVPNSLELLQKRAEEALDSASQGLLAGNLVDELAFRSNFDGSAKDANHAIVRNRCRYCGKIFGSDSALQIHLRSHTGERPFKCDVCGTCFTTKGNLKVHYQRHTQSYYSVELAAKKFQLQTTHLIAGAESPIGMTNANHIKPYPMPLASHSTFPNDIFNQLMMKHIANTQRASGSSKIAGLERAQPNTPPPPVSPPAAPLPPTYMHNTSHGLNAHEHDTDKRRTASPNRQSPSSFRSSSNEKCEHLASHDILLTKSLDRKRSASNGCRSKAFDVEELNEKLLDLRKKGNLSKKEWENLIEIAESPETAKLEALTEINNEKKATSEPNECPICNRILSCRSALRQHFRIHTGERPFRCRICNRAFTTKGNLKTHIAVHKLKPFMKSQHKCPICHKHYASAIILQQHMSVHAAGGGTNESTIIDPLSIDQMRGNSDFPSLITPSETSSLSTHDYLLESETSSIDYTGISMDDYNSSPENEHNSDTDANCRSANRDSIDRETVGRANDDDGDDARDNQKRMANVESLEKGNDAGVVKRAQQQRLQQLSHSDLLRSAVDPSMFARFPPIFHHHPHRSLAPNLLANARAFNAMGPTVLPLAPPPPPPFTFPGTPSAMTAHNPPTNNSNALPEPNGFFNDLHTGFRGNTTCNICFKTFACHSALEIHYRSHTKERPYKCSICDRGFSTKVIKGFV